MTWPTLDDLKTIYKPLPAVATVAAVWEILRRVFTRLSTRLPRRAVLGDLAKNHIPCLLFVNHLFTPSRNGIYGFCVPDYFPPHTTGQLDGRRNIPYVFATSDATAISDLFNAMGQVGRYENIEIVDPVTHWQQWDATIVCIGGSFKADEIFRKVNDVPVKLDVDSFRLPNCNRVLRATAGQDFGLICKATNPDNQHQMWLIIGLGIRGTESAGFYLRNSLRLLGNLFGCSCFAVIVCTSLTGGGRQASLYWHSSVRWFRKLLHPINYWRVRKDIARWSGTGEAHKG